MPACPVHALDTTRVGILVSSAGRIALFNGAFTFDMANVFRRGINLFLRHIKHVWNSLHRGLISTLFDMEGCQTSVFDRLELLDSVG